MFDWLVNLLGLAGVALIVAVAAPAVAQPVAEQARDVLLGARKPRAHRRGLAARC